MLAAVILALAMSQTGKVTCMEGWYSSNRKHFGASCAELKARSGQACDLSGAFVGWARTGLCSYRGHGMAKPSVWPTRTRQGRAVAREDQHRVLVGGTDNS